MARKTTVLGVALWFGLMCLVTAPRAARAIYQTQLSVGGGSDARISNSHVVWYDWHNLTVTDPAGAELYVQDLVTGTQKSIAHIYCPNIGCDEFTRCGPDISDRWVVWTDSRPDSTKGIFLYDLETGVETHVTSTGLNPAVSGGRIVWADGLANSQIYVYDIATGVETRITNSPWKKRQPMISGNRIVYEDYRSGMWNSNSDIYLYDLSTGIETPIATAPYHQTRPAISGDHIVWEDLRNGDYDVYMYDLSTGIETPIATGFGWQTSPAISGDRIVWEDNRDQFYYSRHIYLFDLASGTETQITSDPDEQFAPAIYQDMVVWQGVKDRNWNVYLTSLNQTISFTPSAYDFGDVEVGARSTAIVTLTNVGGWDVSVDGFFACDGCHASDPCIRSFSVQPFAPLPATLAPGNTLDAVLTFAPVTEGACHVRLSVVTSPLQGYSFPVLALSGTGVRTEPPPSEQVRLILEAIEDCVAAGTCSGSGSGGSAGGRLGAFRNMIEASGDLIEAGRIDEACRQLTDAYNRTDGNDKPPEFVQGAAAADLAAMIRVLKTSLGCP